MSDAPVAQVQVLVVGAGGSGLAAALELAARGVTVRIVDRATGPCTESRGTGLQPRTLELLEMHDATRDLVAAGNPISTMTAFLDQERVMEVDFRLAPSPYPSIALPQSGTEGVLRRRLAERGVHVEWGTQLTDLAQDADGVDAVLAGGAGDTSTVRADWLVGADGASSTVRDRIGLTFEGTSYAERWGLMDVDLDWDLPDDSVRIFQTSRERGQFIVVPFGGRRYRVQTDQMDANDDGRPTLAGMQERFDRYTRLRGTLSNPVWGSNFRIHRRQVVAYRSGRVFLAGDSAHIHAPAGGQGLNTGIQDGINLGWKLAHVARGLADEALLDTYEQERHPVAAAVLRMTEVLARTPERAGSFDPDDMARRAAVVSQCALTYRDGPLGDPALPDAGHLQAGDRVPDVELGDRHLYELLRGRRVVVAVLGGAEDDVQWPGDLAVDVVRIGTEVPDPRNGLAAALGVDRGAVVIRPDGHLGCVAHGDPGDARERVRTYLHDVLRLHPVSTSVDV